MHKPMKKLFIQRLSSSVVMVKDISELTRPLDHTKLVIDRHFSWYKYDKNGELLFITRAQKMNDIRKAGLANEFVYLKQIYGVKLSKLIATQKALYRYLQQERMQRRNPRK